MALDLCWSKGGEMGVSLYQVKNKQTKKVQSHREQFGQIYRCHKAFVI